MLLLKKCNFSLKDFYWKKRLIKKSYICSAWVYKNYQLETHYCSLQIKSCWRVLVNTALSRDDMVLGQICVLRPVRSNVYYLPCWRAGLTDWHTSLETVRDEWSLRGKRIMGTEMKQSLTFRCTHTNWHAIHH